MKKPNIKNLKIDNSETKKIRSSMANQKSIKITININAETLAKLRAIADSSGIPYQRLINRTLSESISAKDSTESRLEQVEKELRNLKKRLSA